MASGNPILNALNRVSLVAQIAIGFQQGHAHFAQHVGHVAFGDAGLAADVLDQAREFFGKGGGHVRKGDGKGRWNAARTREIGKSRARRERRAKRAAAAVAKA